MRASEGEDMRSQEVTVWGALARVVDAFKLDLVLNSRRVDLSEAQHVTAGRWPMRVYRVSSQLNAETMAACLRSHCATATLGESAKEVGVPGAKDPAVEDGKPEVMPDGTSPSRTVLGLRGSVTLP